MVVSEECLAAVNMNMQVEAKKEDFTKQELLGIMQMIEDTTDEVRKTSHNLMPFGPAAGKPEGSVAAIIATMLMSSNGALCIELNTYGDCWNRVHATYIAVIFRIVQELVQNVIRHAAASHIIVSLERTGNHISLLVEDNGTGFDVGKALTALAWKT